MTVVNVTNNMNFNPQSLHLPRYERRDGEAGGGRQAGELLQGLPGRPAEPAVGLPRDRHGQGRLRVRRVRPQTLHRELRLRQVIRKCL